MILLSANSVDASKGDSSTGRWVIGILTSQGFENKDTFFGSSGHLYAISPIFRVFSPSGRLLRRCFSVSKLFPNFTMKINDS